VVALHKELVLGAFDPEQARALGYSRWLDLVLLPVIQAIVATCVPAVGTVLAVALLIVPALTARLWCERMGSTMALGAALGSLSASSGSTTLMVCIPMALAGLSFRPRSSRSTTSGGDTPSRSHTSS